MSGKFIITNKVVTKQTKRVGLRKRITRKIITARWSEA